MTDIYKILSRSSNWEIVEFLRNGLSEKRLTDLYKLLGIELDNYFEKEQDKLEISPSSPQKKTKSRYSIIHDRMEEI